MPPQANPTPPTDAQLRADLEAERAKNARLEAEGRSYLDAARSEWDRAERAQQALRENMRPPAARVDPFQKLSQEGVALDPEKQQELLDHGTRLRARDEFSRGAQELERRRLADQYQLETKLALNFFRQQHPAIAADQEGLAAALTRAQIRASNQRLNLDPVEMLQLGLSIYNENKGTTPGGAEIPYTEGASVPGGPSVNTTRPAEPAPPSIWEKLYGATDVVSEDDPNWSLDGMTEKYLDAKNLELVKEGFTSKIGQIMGQIQEATARRKAAAA